MSTGRGLTEVPRSLRQFLRRLPVGRLSVYLNELQPSNQQFFLLMCMANEEKNQKEDVRGIRISRKDVSSHLSVQMSGLRGNTTQEQSENSFCCNSVPILEHMETILHLPKGSNGVLEAKRTPHPTLLVRPHLYYLAVPRTMFDDNTNYDGRTYCDVEAVLQQHLVQVKKTLYWRKRKKRREKEEDEDVATSAPDVMLEAIWGCTIPQLRQAAEVAATYGYRVFVLGHPHQRLLSNEGVMVRELGYWCPSVFRSFHLDIRSVESSETSTHISPMLFLEEARRGFLVHEDASEHIGNGGNNNNAIVRHDNNHNRRVKSTLSFAVAEVIVDAKRDGLVPWTRVCDDFLTSRLFEALYDRRHNCVMDAVMYASQRVVLPFLLGDLLLSTSSVDIHKENKTIPSYRIMRWSELYTILRWRFFEPAFGSFSQIIRTEDVVVIGGGLDPFVFPLHDIFITRVLLPRMCEYYYNCGKNSVTSAREFSSLHVDKITHTATVDILDCFNAITIGQKDNFTTTTTNSNSNNGNGALQNEEQKQRKVVDGYVSNNSGNISFSLEDLPSLVKYLFCFDQYFEVIDNGTSVTFTLPER